MKSVTSHSPLLAATSHLLTSKARNRVKSRRCAILLAVVGGYSSLADERGEGEELREWEACHHTRRAGSGHTSRADRRGEG